VVEMGSHELFAWAGLKPWSSWSMPLEWLVLQVCVTHYTQPIHIF
jgi:hypothetical protein